MAEQFANNPVTTLLATISGSDTVAVVNDPSLFSASGTFRILIDSEIIAVTAVSGSTFTITRATENTSAASHTAGTSVRQIVTAEAVTQLKADVVATAAAALAVAIAALTESFIVPCSDETTALATGTAKVTFRAPYALILTSVKASLTTVSSSGVVTVDINKNGTTIFSTRLTIDANELTSVTAAAAYVFSAGATVSIAADDYLTIDIDDAGTGATGLKVTFVCKKG